MSRLESAVELRKFADQCEDLAKLCRKGAEAIEGGQEEKAGYIEEVFKELDKQLDEVFPP